MESELRGRLFEQETRSRVRLRMREDLVSEDEAAQVLDLMFAKGYSMVSSMRFFGNIRVVIFEKLDTALIERCAAEAVADGDA